MPETHFPQLSLQLGQSMGLILPGSSEVKASASNAEDPGSIPGFALVREKTQQKSSLLGFSDGSDGKASVCNAEDPGLIPGSGRSPGERNGNPLQYFCLENPMDRGAW